MDLNSDLGEGYGAWSMGDDDALLNIVTSANVACGYHAGDPVTMRRTVATAAERGISVGAHVSYPDRRGFGRRHVVMSAEELAADLLYQLGALEAMTRVAGTRVRYVKPHGALYNEMAVDAELAATVAGAIAAFDPALPLLGLPGSVALAEAERAGLPVFREGFADRAYDRDGRLVPRGRPGAVLHDPDLVAARVLRMARGEDIEAEDGTSLRLDVDTVCIHGDSPGAVDMARRVRDVLGEAGVAVAPFVRA